jgi:hypothetical protein
VPPPLRCPVVEAQFDLHAELARGSGDAAGTWHFIRLFAAQYTRPIVAGDGWDDTELLAAETRLGFSLPMSMRMAYGLMGKRRDLTDGMDRLLAPHQLEIDETRQMLVFRWECQRVVEWGVPLSAVAESDPPVAFRYSSAHRWFPYLERFSLAWVEMVLSEWVMGGAAHGTDLELDDETIAVMEQRLRRLPLPEYPFRPGGGLVRWFEASGAIAREDSGTWLWVGAASRDGIAAVQRALPGDWSSNDE